LEAGDGLLPPAKQLVLPQMTKKITTPTNNNTPNSINHIFIIAKNIKKTHC
jgi:hypothetical protein